MLIASCSKKDLSPKDYVAWVEEEHNGLSVTKEFDDVSYQVLYKPVNYIVAKELLNGAITAQQVTKRISELGNMQYFTLRIKSKNANELLSAGIKEDNEYYQRLEYFMGSMQDDINLIEENDTIPCALHHFERTYGLAPYNNFVLGFKQANADIKDKIMVYDDKVMGTGKLLLKIKADAIKQLPNIIWN